MTHRAHLSRNPSLKFASQCTEITLLRRSCVGGMSISYDWRGVILRVFSSYLRSLHTQLSSEKGKLLTKTLFGSVNNFLPKNTGATVSMFNFNTEIAPVKAADDSGVFEPFPRSSSSVPFAALQIAQMFAVFASNTQATARKLRRPNMGISCLPSLAA